MQPTEISGCSSLYKIWSWPVHCKPSWPKICNPPDGGKTPQCDPLLPTELQPVLMQNCSIWALGSHKAHTIRPKRPECISSCLFMFVHPFFGSHSIFPTITLTMSSLKTEIFRTACCQGGSTASASRLDSNQRTFPCLHHVRHDTGFSAPGADS